MCNKLNFMFISSGRSCEGCMQKHTQHRFKIKLTPKLFTFDPDPEYAKRTNH